MITNGASSLELRFDAYIDNVSVDYTAIQRVNIELHENMHNLATVEMVGIPPEILLEYIDKPIILSVSVGNQRRHDFYGYVVYLEPESVAKDGLVNKSPFQITKLYCLGPSYLMRSRKNNAWDNTTLPMLAQDYASQYRFSLSVPNNKTVFPRLVQSNESDWHSLVTTASKLGYSTIMRGTHIDIWDPFAALSRDNIYSKLYTIQGLNGVTKSAPGQIIKFKAKVGNITSHNARVPDTIFTLTKDNNNIVEIATDLNQNSGLGTPITSIFKDEIAINADSVYLARALIDGRSRDKFPYSADVDVVGDPSIEPGMIVSIERYSSDLDGFWYVSGVHHEFFRGSIISHLSLKKDAITNTGVLAPVVASPRSIPPKTVFREDRWIAEREVFDVYT
jgi:hypothetical protein